MLAPDFDRRWQAIRQRADAFAVCAPRLGLKTSWGAGNPFDEAEPPASEAGVRAVERAIGFELPLSLRQFFLRASAGIEFSWSLPYHEVMTRHGVPDIVYDLIPPPPFQVKRDEGTVKPAQAIGPRIAGGALSIVLSHVEPLCRQAAGWADRFETQARAARDETARIRYRNFAQAWRCGVPFAGVGNGDLIAVDADHPAEHLVCLDHEGVDVPAYSLGRPLLDHLEQVSRLGFVWHDLLFADEAACRDIEARAEADRPYDASLGLRLVEAGVMSADNANADLWRRWLDWPDGGAGKSCARPPAG